MIDIYTLMSLVLTSAVVVAYINHRYIHLQPTIAIMLSSLLLSLGLIIAGQFGYTHLQQQVAQILARIDFYHLLMNGMLSFLLFAGALNVNINDLKERQWEVFTLATFSTIASTLLVGIFTYYLLNALHIPISFIYCLLFGALISPTDPIAVLAMCKEVKAPRKLGVSIAGESLFNDGVGIVLFLTIYQIAFTDSTTTWESISVLFLQEACGGILYGLGLGLVGYWLIKSIDDHKLEILITLSIATGGYALAQSIKVSGPLAMVVAGILIGNHGRRFSMSVKTQENLDNFWELVDEVLNVLLFFLIGFELLVIKITSQELIASALAILLVLLVRFLTVAAPLSLFKLKEQYAPHSIKILTWGGLRGGLAVALALALPPSPYRNLILAMTYAVVIFSIAIQGTTIKPLIRLSKQQTD
ncbi:MAG: nhaP [Gammaproteobacteria bacterium]|jgi:CPA1 family monovalent cation:H+ antiporter|nr:nhaP [Gammaproteobacteria bacterium]